MGNMLNKSLMACSLCMPVRRWKQQYAHQTPRLLAQMTDLDIRRPDRQPYELGDRYRTGSGPVVLTGVQAIARALVEQHERDARAGLRAATFVSGYQGSPLGGVDRMLAAMPDVLAAHDITFVPGLNEELAATSVWGRKKQSGNSFLKATTTGSGWAQKWSRPRFRCTFMTPTAVCASNPTAGKRVILPLHT